ncbi:MAG: DUF4333 domain-containing protein, partial [Solirubrobacteraceae bacterium]
MSRWPVTLVAVQVAIGLSACGSGSKSVVIDHNVVQNAIEVGVAQQQHVLSIVTCPPGITAKKGVTFACTVTFADGKQGSVTVTGIDDQGNVRYSGLNGFVRGQLPKR